MSEHDLPEVGFNDCTTDTGPSPIQDAAPSMKVSLMACGGCATNQLAKLVKRFPDLTKKAHLQVFDTSDANLGKIDGLGLTVHMLADAGSGKIRSTHATSILNTLSTSNIDYGDVTICMFSMSGGSVAA